MPESRHQERDRVASRSQVAAARCASAMATIRELPSPVFFLRVLVVPMTELSLPVQRPGDPSQIMVSSRGGRHDAVVVMVVGAPRQSLSTSISPANGAARTHVRRHAERTRLRRCYRRRMPELPDIVLYLEQLERRIAGATLDQVRVASP